MEVLMKIALILFSLVGTISTAIIGYFITKYFKDIDIRDAKQTEAIELLNDSSKTLLTAIEVLKVKQKNYEIALDRHTHTVTLRLNSHHDKLEEHDREITTLKTKIG